MTSDCVATMEQIKLTSREAPSQYERAGEVDLGKPQANEVYPWLTPRRERHVKWPEVKLCTDIAQDPSQPIALVEDVVAAEQVLKQAHLTAEEEYVLRNHTPHDTEEIAQRLGCSEKTVIRRLRSAQIKVQRIISKNL